jgi:hypothetical protein
MKRAIRCRNLPELPRLAWLARVDTTGGDVVVYHGSAVECRADWMVEGVWDGEFRIGTFHQSDHFFGSGIRVDGARVYFVPSSALVNRIMYCEHRGHIVVSNSLALLLAFTGARLDPGHDYRMETYAIRHGARGYRREFTIVHPEIASFYQVYDESLVLDGGTVAFASLRPAPAIPTYEAYRRLVDDCLLRLRQNYTSPDRRTRFTAFATISSGYDSAATAVLVKDLGISACFTSRRSNSHIPRWASLRAGTDDGKPIADLLGLRTMYLDDRRSRISEDEVYFFAPGCAPSMPVLHSLARHLDQRDGATVLFTGFQGDEVWDVNPGERAYQKAGIVRGDVTALMLSEIRLKCGFINVAVPSLYARAVRDLALIAASPEMAPWRLHTTYDRPIPRRILETAGVPRALFGARKKAVVERRSYPSNRALRRQFLAHIRAQYGCPAAVVYLHDVLNKLAFPFVRGWHLLRRALLLVEPRTLPAVLVWKRFDFMYLMFGWAAGALSEHYKRVLQKGRVTPETARPRRRAAPSPAALRHTP